MPVGPALGVGCRSAPVQGRVRTEPASTRLWGRPGLRQSNLSKEARERKYDQTDISYLSKQLDTVTTRETIWALRRWPFGRLNGCQRAAYLISISILSARHISFQFQRVAYLISISIFFLSLEQIIFIKPLVRRQTGKNQSQPRNPVEAVCNLLTQDTTLLCITTYYSN